MIDAATFAAAFLAAFPRDGAELLGYAWEVWTQDDSKSLAEYRQAARNKSVDDDRRYTGRNHDGTPKLYGASDDASDGAPEPAAPETPEELEDADYRHLLKRARSGFTPRESQVWVFFRSHYRGGSIQEFWATHRHLAPPELSGLQKSSHYGLTLKTLNKSEANLLLRRTTFSKRRGVVSEGYADHHYA